MEAERARSLKNGLSDHQDRAFHTDSFLLHPSYTAADRATVLFLNPPYDQDPEYGRLEHRFLLRFTQMLHPGAGVLLFLAPAHALATSAEHLARNYLELRAWRFPGEDFDSFGQVLLLGRRSGKPLTDTTMADTVRRWAEEPETLPELPEECPDPLELDVKPFPAFNLELYVEELDVTAALEAHRPLGEEVVGLNADATDLLGARFQTAAPPKPAHIALALSSGMFNGWPLAPNDPERHPPLLAKGVFERENLIVSEKTNQEGEVTGVVEIEQPRLRLTVLRLDEMSFHELAPGTVPTESDDVSEWNAADLIANYDRSLAKLLARQFPALHDPTRTDHEIALPELPRTPFAVQSQAIQTGLKLLASERNPMLVAEVGTGKTTMALMIAAALSPRHYEQTLRELRRVGLCAKPPRVSKTLVVCPPHLLGTWEEEAAAVVPDWRVQVVRSPSDLDQPAELYVLSRETAKLGHAWAGLAKGGQCPRCGAEVETAAKTNASTRRVCQAVLRRPTNLIARLAEDLATVLLPAAPGSSLLRSLVRAPALLRHFDPDADGQPIAIGALASFTRTFARAVTRIAKEPTPSPSHHHALGTALRILARATGLAREALEILPASNDYEASWLRVCRSSLSNAAAGEEGASLDLPALVRAAETLQEAGTWEEGPPCGEPFFQALGQPRRVPLADVIRRHHRRQFQLVILDEAHEYAHGSSAQSKAAHRLSGLPGAATVVLTGSLMGGYASSLFTNFWHLSPLFRREFGRSEQSLFLDRYGYRKTLRIPNKDASKRCRRGSYTDRDVDGRRTLGEAPGVMPTFVMRHLLPTAVLVHKEDLDCELPPLTEEPAVLVADPEDDYDGELLTEYRRIQAKLLQCVRQDRRDPDRAGRLLGALVELPSYLDRATDDLPPFEVRYPETLGGELVARAKSFPASWKTPKERWLLAELAHLIEAGEKVLVFLRHTGTPHLPQRLLRLIEEEVTPRVAWLDASKVTTRKRQKWIDRHVVDAGTQVLLVNPNAVRTGLNNLVTFSTGIWHQLDFSAQTYRQANGRLHRIGQTRPVTILIPFYEDTAQEVAFDLVARKVGASLQVDGLDLQAALEAAGASEDRTAAMATAMSLGQAVYKALTGGAPKRRRSRPVGKPAPRPAPESAPRPAPSFPPTPATSSEPVQLSLL